MSNTLQDLTGKRFGRVVVLSHFETVRYSGCSHVKWACECDCGTRFVCFAGSLRRGATVSCGCLHREQLKRYKDLTGSTFGRLAVIGEEGRDKQNKRRWFCKCQCGKSITIRGTSLTSGHTTSCGCRHREESAKRATKHGLSRTREYINAKAKERLERKAKLDSEWTPELEKSLLELQKSCVLCGSSNNLTVDHVLPLSKGYGLKPGNAAVLCGSCNSRKHDKLPNELPQVWQDKLSTATVQFEQYVAQR